MFRSVAVIIMVSASSFISACSAVDSNASVVANSEAIPALLGTYKMYTQPATESHAPDSNCDLYYEMKVSTGQLGGLVASLTPRLSDASTCELTLPKRSYNLVLFSAPAADSCGSQSADLGATIRVNGDFLRNAQGSPVVLMGSIVDHRQSFCEEALEGRIVVRFIDEAGYELRFFNFN